MSRVPFYLTVFILTAGLVSTALLQLSSGSDTPFYVNGVDEFVYLSYGYAVESAKQFTRPAQLLIVGLHQIGISPGWINLILDVVLIPLIFVGAVRIFRELSFPDSKSKGMALILILFPSVLAVNISPLGDLLQYMVESGHLAWITFPHFDFFIPARTPEPQFSLAVALWIIAFAIRRRAFWPLYVAAPFIYTFIAIPLLIGSIAIQLSTRRSEREWWIISEVFGFILVGVILGVHFAFGMSDEARGHLTQSRIPLLSLIALLNLSILPFVSLKGHGGRSVLRILALLPLFTVNTQIVSGWIAQPNNFEQYASAFITSFLVSLAVKDRLLLRKVVLLFSVGATIGLVLISYNKNRTLTHKLELTDELKLLLKDVPGQVAINDLRAALAAGMIYPRQDGTRLAYWRTQLSLAEKNIDSYLCARNRILRDPVLSDKFREVFVVLDEAYAYEQKNYIFNTIARRVMDKPIHDVSKVPVNCSDLPLYIYTVEDHQLQKLLP